LWRCWRRWRTRGPCRSPPALTGESVTRVCGVTSDGGPAGAEGKG
jgi:hypothetical protein